MATRPAEEIPTPQAIAAYVRTNAARARKAQQMHHGESTVTREADYKGHHIIVRTKYKVEVDGQPLMGHLGVNDAGSVHYHPIPNMSFGSAIDMVKKIIDVFPHEFGPNSQPNSMPGMNGALHRMGGKKMRTKTPSGKTVMKKRSK
jgi:hypothetical protein